MSLTPTSLTPMLGPVSERRPWVAVVETPAYLARAEKILDEVIAPLAAQGPVLMVVIDGMSAAVCRENSSSVRD